MHEVGIAMQIIEIAVASIPEVSDESSISLDSVERREDEAMEDLSIEGPPREFSTDFELMRDLVCDWLQLHHLFRFQCVEWEMEQGVNAKFLTFPRAINRVEVV